MKNLKFLLLAVIALSIASCSGGASLSKKEALNYIVEDLGDSGYRSLSIPIGIKSQSSINDYDIQRYTTYQRAGLITIQDTTTVYRSWGRTSTIPAYDINFTAAGQAAIMHRGESSNTVLIYRYEYDKVVDIKLIAKKSNEEFKAESHTYLVYYSGKVTEASAFGNAEGITIEENYPFSPSCEEDAVIAGLFEVMYRDGKMINMSDGNYKTVLKSKMQEHYDEVWYELASRAM